MLAGCAAPPNTPGAGYGKNYTPVIDTDGVDSRRYSKDLDDCRRFAGIIDADKAALQGLIGGIILGALVGAAYGGRRNAEFGASAGGGAGLGAAANKAANQQERILINCMAGRGYRTLDGSAAASTSYPSPYGPQSSQQPTAPAQSATGTPASAMPVPLQAAAPQFTAATKGAGKDLIQAEKFARQQSCSPNLTPWPAAMEPGSETYSATCNNGATIIIRCEYGNCRALR